MQQKYQDEFMAIKNLSFKGYIKLKETELFKIKELDYLLESSNKRIYKSYTCNKTKLMGYYSQ